MIGRSLAPAVGFRAVVEQSPDIVTVLSAEGQLQYTNQAGQRLLGHDFALHAEQAVEFVHPDDLDVLLTQVAQLIAERGRRTAFVFRIRHADGTWRHLETFGSNLVDDDGAGAVVLYSRDVSAQYQAEERLEHERLHDALTGLPTRPLFLEYVRRGLLRAERTGATTAVFGIDIDSFSVVNERFGFERGDEVLRGVGRGLEAALRKYDSVARAHGVVARFGGDEFFVLCEDVPDAHAAAAIAERLAAAVSAHRGMTDREDMSVTATVGIAFSASACDAESLLVDATSATRVGKRAGGDRVEFFDEHVREDAESRARQVRDLCTAIDTGQLRLVYQPKIDISSAQICGVEALVRWEHPERGTVSPAEFIPLAEETGLIEPLGEWVLIEACRQRAAWTPIIPPPGRLLMCVNVSSRQFNRSFPALVERVIAETGVPADSLCIEVTESAVMNEVDEAVRTMLEIRTLGVQISIDDFGTGFSSLAQLKRLPLDELKIDQSFVNGLGHDDEDTAIVAAVVAMAHALDLHVIAEGVETDEQLAQLRMLGCDLAQGFLFCRPVGPEEIGRLWSGASSIGPARAAEPVQTGRGDIVLVVDDTADVRQLAHVSLSAAGFEVIEATDGREALTAARELQPVCVLLDVSMPGMSGLEVCRALRADLVTADCTIVMLTGNASAEDKVAAFSAGADDYMVKPFAPRDVVGRVRSAINRRRVETPCAGQPRRGRTPG